MSMATMPQETTTIRTVCCGCTACCGVEYELSGETISAARSCPELGLGMEKLCEQARWGHLLNPERLTRPLVQRDLARRLGLSQVADANTSSTDPFQSSHVPVSWDIALDLVAGQLTSIVQSYGPDAFATLVSARATNEEGYLAQKLARASMGTNNIASAGCPGQAEARGTLLEAFGWGAGTTPLTDIGGADCILVVGAGNATANAMVEQLVGKSVARGASLILVNTTLPNLEPSATVRLRVYPGEEAAVLQAMASLIIDEGWYDEAFIAARAEGFGAFASAAKAARQADLLVSPALIAQAAKSYALGLQAQQAEPNMRRGRAMIVYLPDSNPPQAAAIGRNLARLALLSGQIGRASTGICILGGQANIQGIYDMGVTPELLPGQISISDSAARKAIAWAWGAPDLPARPGRSAADMLAGATAGQLRALYLVGDMPDGIQVPHDLGFLVVQASIPHPAAQQAHVILPATAHLEQQGTFTNSERRVQRLRPVLNPPAAARAGWQIICSLGQRLDTRLNHIRDPWDYRSVAAVMDEIGEVAPIYRGLTHQRLAQEGRFWPCPTSDDGGTPLLYSQRFPYGRGRFVRG